MYDVVVVGGGPAGSATAAALAQAGWHVALFDRADFPRDKACGEFLTCKARDLLDELGAGEAVRAAGLQTVRATVLHDPEGVPTRHTPPDGRAAGYALRRTTLDALLLKHARRCGVEVRTSWAVRELRRDSAGFVTGVRTSQNFCELRDGAANSAMASRSSERRCEVRDVAARLVIGADGTHSLVARELGLVKAISRLQRLAVVSHWRGVSGDAIEMRANGATVCGLGFPDADAANLTLVVPPSEARRIAGRAGAFVEETVETRFPDLAERLRGAHQETDVRPVGCFGHACRPAVADGALLVGDAATFIDPFTGEGVFFALRGAQMAAEAADAALRRGDTSRRSLWNYERARSELRRRYLLLDAVQAVVRNPALLRHVMRRLRATPQAADRLLTVLSDLRPPTDMLHPAFLWRMVWG